MIHQFLQRSGAGEYENCKFGTQTVEIFDNPKMKNSLIYGGQFFDSPNIEDSTFGGFCRVSGRPHVARSHISGTAQVSGFAIVRDSVLYENAVVTKSSRIIDSWVGDNARVMDGAWVVHADLREQAMVCGTAHVIGHPDEPLIIGGWAFICEGTWIRPPVHYVTSSGFVVTESVGRNISIGCITNTVEKWQSGAGEKYGKLVGLDKHQIAEIEYFVNEIAYLKNSEGYDMGV